LEQSGQTICALATPAGDGAVGMIRISGPGALALIRRLCRGARLTPRTMQPLTLRLDGEALDRALVCFMPAPRSYTGEDVVEVHGHGGGLNMERLLAAVVSLGARLAQPGEFTRRAFLSGRLDLSQAEAVEQIIVARSARALKNAQQILDGALGRRLAAIRAQLVRQAAALEAVVDFVDDVDAAALDAQAVGRELTQAGAALWELAESYQQGRRVDGARVALVGPVNAGKSSLFNRLIGAPRALVSEEPGTTRDYLEAAVSWGGHRIVLVDTAGARGQGEGTHIERAGQELARPVIEQCDLVLHVFDVATQAAPRPLEGLVVANKVDLAPAPPRGVIATSALDGTGIEQLRRRVVEQLFTDHGAAETVMVTRRRQWEALCRAARAVDEAREALSTGVPPELVAEHLRVALGAVGEVTGERFTEEVLDAVFSSFCIGK